MKFLYSFLLAVVFLVPSILVSIFVFYDLPFYILYAILPLFLVILYLFTHKDIVKLLKIPLIFLAVDAVIIPMLLPMLFIMLGFLTRGSIPNLILYASFLATLIVYPFVLIIVILLKQKSKKM